MRAGSLRRNRSYRGLIKLGRRMEWNLGPSTYRIIRGGFTPGFIEACPPALA